ncbi:hypothetical protein ScPMuIL_014152, partial [Solemya velum]
EISNYQVVKKAILKAYELVPGAYRQKFRNSRKRDEQTHVEFAREKEQLFNRWCDSKEIDEDFGKLRQLLLIEEFKRFMYQLQIKQYKSSAYHPESQGALERFHQTLKNMMRSYCFENKRDWDEGIHMLLFGVRESVQESLGFSPFELVFGHT